MKKLPAILGGAAAAVIAGILIYDYAYLFKGIKKTYLRGQRSATIDDLKLFSGNPIKAGKPRLWEEHEDYNTHPLSAALRENLESTRTASFLVVKNGKMLHEEYWNGHNESTLTNSFSMAKTVTAMLLGKAIEEGKIKSLDQKFTDFYAGFAQKEHGEHLTLRHLAEMEAGLDWDEDYKNPFKPNARAYYGNSVAKAVFSRKLKVQPGTRFEYQSGATQLLGFAIRKAVGQTLADYLSEKFWIPMGMESHAAWTTDDTGMEKTFCCIHAVSRDFAKFGQLFLDGGKVGDDTLLNADFLQQIITPTEKSGGIYGLSMWINHDHEIKHYFFQGNQGQNIIVIPEEQMVIVRTGSYNNQPKNDRGRPEQVRFMVNETVQIFK